jgi:hypothetical protein
MTVRFERRHFGLPIADQALTLALAALFVVVAALVLLADLGALSPALARMLRGNPDALGPRAFAALLGVAGVGTAIRTRLAGVVIEEDRVIVRTSAALGVPRVRMAYWAELRGASVEGDRVLLTQYDGSPFAIPTTGEPRACAELVRDRLARFHVRVDGAPSA